MDATPSLPALRSAKQAGLGEMGLHELQTCVVAPESHSAHGAESMTADTLLTTLATQPWPLPAKVTDGHVVRLCRFLDTWGRTWPAMAAPVTMRGRRGECHTVARLVARDHPDHGYCEGLAARHVHGDVIHATLHAWVVTPAGYAIDVTWKHPATDYLGVVLQRHAVERLRQTCGLDGVLFTLGLYPDLFENLPSLLDPRWHSP